MTDRNSLTTPAGVEIPRIIYGTAWKKDHTADLVVKAILAGFRGIDTACQPKHYDESLIGVALQRLRDEGIAREDLYLQTKFTPLPGQDPNQVPYDRHAPLDVQVAQSFTVSKNNLRTEYVDCLILHSPLPNHRLLMQAWQAMETILNTGGARQLGISNCYDIDILKLLHTDASVKPAVVQNRFCRDTAYDADIRRWCDRHGVIYQSFWTLTANPHILSSSIVQELSHKHQKTAAQILFRYLCQTGVVPLTGTCSEQHMREDLDILEFELSVTDCDKLNSLFNPTP